MVLTLLKRLLISINVFNHPIKPVKLELMISLSIAGKELEPSRLSDTRIKDIYFKAEVSNRWSADHWWPERSKRLVTVVLKFSAGN